MWMDNCAYSQAEEDKRKIMQSNSKECADEECYDDSLMASNKE